MKLKQMFFWNSIAFSKCTLNIWKFSVQQVLLKPGLENFEHYFAGMWDECNCAVVWTFFGMAFLWDWNENWSFPVLWALLSFPNCTHCRYKCISFCTVVLLGSSWAWHSTTTGRHFASRTVKFAVVCTRPALGSLGVGILSCVLVHLLCQAVSWR